MSVKIRVKTLDNVPVPSYQTAGAAGMDLYANEALTIPPKSWRTIGTGLIFELPSGFELQIRSRSGLASKGIIVLNQPGTLDSDYRGELKVMLLNLNTKPWIVSIGDRIAQAILSQVFQAEIITASHLSTTVRGSGGFGSTGQR